MQFRTVVWWLYIHVVGNRKMFGKRTSTPLLLMICLVAGVRPKTENFIKTEVSKKFWDEAVQVAHTRHGVNRSV